MVGDVHDVITCAKFQTEIFMGYDFIGDRIFDFLIDFAWALKQCSANALPVIGRRREACVKFGKTAKQGFAVPCFGKISRRC